MSYHMWYLSTSDERVPYHEFAELIENVGEYSLTLTQGTDSEWVQVALAHKKGDHAIGDLKCVPVHRGAADDTGAQNIAWFLKEIESAKPACNVPWLRKFLPHVATIYVWSLYDGTEVDDGWAPVRAIGEALTENEDTAVYAELEGWSNTEGDHITWEFSNQVDGVWSMSLMQVGRWHRFRMDLADRKARACFKKGVVPPGVKVTVYAAESDEESDEADE